MFVRGVVCHWRTWKLPELQHFSLTRGTTLMEHQSLNLSSAKTDDKFLSSSPEFKFIFLWRPFCFLYLLLLPLVPMVSFQHLKATKYCHASSPAQPDWAGKRYSSENNLESNSKWLQKKEFPQTREESVHILTHSHI